MPKLIPQLSEARIRTAKPGEKPYYLNDGKRLRLLVRPSGTKVWQYPYRLNGKYNVCTIGHYGEVSTAEARQKRDEIRRLIREGIDPNGYKKGERIRQMYEGRNSFEAVAREWIGKQCWSAPYIRNVTHRMEYDVFPSIGRKPLPQITRQDILYLLRAIEKRGSLCMAKTVSQYCTRVFLYAQITGVADNNPATGMGKAVRNHQVQHRPYLSESQLPEFLRKLEAHDCWLPAKLAMKLLVLTFVRSGELRGASWGEINEEKAEWRIPAHRMKMRRDHIVPLSPQALELIRQVRALSGHRELVFPGGHSQLVPMSSPVLNHIFWDLGYRGLATPHGLRATACTILNEHGFRPDVIERQLAHVETNKVRAAYHHSEYLKERREMMNWWGEYVERAIT